MYKIWCRTTILLLLCFFSALFADGIADDLAKAEVFYAQKNYHRAIFFYSRVISIDPRNIIAYEEIGDCYFQLKEFDKALENYKRVQWLNPGTINYRLGLTYYCLGDYRSAKRYFLVLSDNDTVRANTNFYLAKIYEFEDNDSLAIMHLKREIEIVPSENNFLELARFYYKLKKYDEAVGTVDELVKIFPESADGYLIYAEIAEKRGFSEKAIENYRKAAQLGSGEAQLWMEKKGYPWRKEKDFFDKLMFWKD